MCMRLALEGRGCYFLGIPDLRPKGLRVEVFGRVLSDGCSCGRDLRLIGTAVWRVAVQ